MYEISPKIKINSFSKERDRKKTEVECVRLLTDSIIKSSVGISLFNKKQIK